MCVKFGPARKLTDVVVQEEGQVVWDQVLAADTDIERVEVLKVSPHALEGLLGNAGLGHELVRHLYPAEDVVPDLVNHLLGGDVALAPAHR
jgi:hypothetical protein